MNEQKIQELLTALFNLKYDWKTESSHYKSEVINKEGKLNVETIIRGFLLDNRDEKQGILEGKVFMYEQIIAKSNFAPMLEKEVEKIKEKIDS